MPKKAPKKSVGLDGRRRVVIEGVDPELDAGRFAAKRIAGDEVTIAADIFTDGHDVISAVLLYREKGEPQWREVPMTALVNDRWNASFVAASLGIYEFTIVAWVDHFLSWHRDLGKRAAAKADDLELHLRIGAGLVEAAAARAQDADRGRLANCAAMLRSAAPIDARIECVNDPIVLAIMARYPDRSLATTYPRVLEIAVDRERARFSSWYELFPRSASPEPGRHGTLRDVIARLPYVASMGFDVLYLPPIHPIGDAFRKGPNNSLKAGESDPGSPWAIGSDAGGHNAIHPELGTLEDFDRLVSEAARHDIELAMDIAFQASPDHPIVEEHPEFFRKRPDGTIQYAENPPKRYQDIYPFDFETESWESLWNELRDVFLFWCERGIRIFRVDNPHTKSLYFWEWVLAEVKSRYPGTIFLAEAFTRPKVMYYLAKAGFTQSYTYFAWRNQKWEIEQYFRELTRTRVREFFRPNAWPNTPDILAEYLQYGGRPAFMARVALAATLCASYGIYGPAFELGEHVARASGSEEYMDSEKYQIRSWNLDDPESLREYIARINRVRRENRALQSDRRLRFHETTNEQIICYSKTDAEKTNTVLVVVNLDPYHVQSGFVELNLAELGVKSDRAYQYHDLLSGSRFLWQGSRNFVSLDPQTSPAHIFRVRREVRRENNFEYFL